MASSSNKILDCSFMGIVELEDLLQVSPQALAAAASNSSSAGEVKTEDKGAKLKMTSIKLCSNQITSVDTLYPVLSDILAAPTALRWVDLSCNQIERLGDALERFPEIAVLYLHGNQLRSLGELRRLGEQLPGLKSLTLHGNPVEEGKHYRNYLIHFLPSLNQLDFSPITRLDRDKAATWATTFRRKLNKNDNEDLAY
mmetsp:Transcript_14086/g.20751  ORF Transcript_14086/g.20751 Transcript_14086/m.20751 type:complete len:198 (-) Transcript_14086:321-914(-)